ncbi:hypothetical protein JAAARDRAFT_54860 [Jaapia argillacea MUCL 33604]|uniref:BTB domain-containing protein n=1 Tax=Jaapia argillacea MUCL 33604 TaxID=933084 RepID=A0A067Q3F7_9AGAM|nr:hypothetical protein JAAARDRAFT_54860 [Jaapia argillacea MUCL 33604]
MSTPNTSNFGFPKNSSSKCPILISDDTHTDLLVRSSNSVEFRVHKTILAVASPVFRDMFHVVDPLSDDEDEVDLPEDGKTLDRLFRLCYPVDEPTFGSLDSAWNVRKAAKKYIMDAAENRMKEILKQFLPEHPLRMFALACRDGFEDEAKLAARHTLRHPLLSSYVPELEDISGGALYRLLEYRLKCGQLTSELGFDWVPRVDYIFFKSGALHSGACLEMDSGMSMINGRFFPARTWWREYVNRARNALRERPCGEVVTTASLMWPALINAASCSTCSALAHNDLTEFAKVFAEEVEQTTTKIASGMSFVSP